MSVVVRFAPSPTGQMHVGNARVALVNWLFARARGGRFLLRIDDTDTERGRAHFARAIVEDMAWLGLDFDWTETQSRRLDEYAQAAERLRAAGRLYPCYETEEEIALKRKLQRARGAPPVYDRAALALAEDARRALEAEGRRPHWRFKLDRVEVGWEDLIHGPWRIAAASMSDPVLVKSDGQPLFALSTAVDDAEFAISHVIRGEDHVSTTVCQIQLAEALGAPVPRFAHIPLLTDITGAGLSKREGARSLAEMRADGIEAMAINAYLARLGSSDSIEPADSLDELVAHFDIARLGRAGPKFDYADLNRLNARHLSRLPFASMAERLARMGLSDADERFWLAVRANIARLEDARRWYAVCRGEIRPIIADAELAGAAARLLPEGTWDETTWTRWTDALKAETGKKGKALYRPLRLALTGAEEGPELKALLPLIGRARAHARLNGKTA